MLLTKEAYKTKEMQLDSLYDKLDKIRKEKAMSIAQADGDSRHDNFGFEQAEMQERATLKEIRDLTKVLENATIVEEKSKLSSKTVDIGSTVKLEMNYGNGEIEVVSLKLEALLSSEEEIVTLNSPIGRTIFQQKIGFNGECKLGGENIVRIHILDIL